MNMNIKYKNKSSKHLSILSWNIQDCVDDETNKFEIDDFVKYLSTYQIVCLQETKEAVKLQDFTAFNSNRTKSRSGGVSILIHSSLKQGVKKYHVNETPDIICVKLDKNYFKLPFDLYIVCFYISPALSSYTVANPDYTDHTFDTLALLIYKLKTKGEVYYVVI